MRPGFGSALFNEPAIDRKHPMARQSPVQLLLRRSGDGMEAIYLWPKSFLQNAKAPMTGFSFVADTD
jgi:hypothetical protein